MNSYNGFSAAQRTRAQRWLNAMWDGGLLPRPAECVACGQTEGIIDAHAEDYSEPFAGGITDAYHLCFRCHMMVHARFQWPDAWVRYRAEIASGLRFAPMLARNYYRFRAQHLLLVTPVKSERHAPRGDLLAALPSAQVGDVADDPRRRKPRRDQLSLCLD